MIEFVGYLTISVLVVFVIALSFTLIACVNNLGNNGIEYFAFGVSITLFLVALNIVLFYSKPEFYGFQRIETEIEPQESEGEE